MDLTSLIQQEIDEQSELVETMLSSKGNWLMADAQASIGYAMLHELNMTIPCLAIAIVMSILADEAKKRGLIE